jgi:translation elongation factor EF-Ts
MGNKIGVLVTLNKDLNDSVSTVAKDIAKQITAMNPVAVDASGVSVEAIQREKAMRILIDARMFFLNLKNNLCYADTTALVFIGHLVL